MRNSKLMNWTSCFLCPLGWAFRYIANDLKQMTIQDDITKLEVADWYENFVDRWVEHAKSSSSHNQTFLFQIYYQKNMEQFKENKTFYWSTHWQTSYVEPNWCFHVMSRGMCEVSFSCNFNHSVHIESLYNKRHKLKIKFVLKTFAKHCVVY